MHTKACKKVHALSIHCCKVGGQTSRGVGPWLVSHLNKRTSREALAMSFGKTPSRTCLQAGVGTKPQEKDTDRKAHIPTNIRYTCNISRPLGVLQACTRSANSPGSFITLGELVRGLRGGGVKSSGASSGAASGASEPLPEPCNRSEHAQAKAINLVQPNSTMSGLQ